MFAPNVLAPPDRAKTVVFPKVVAVSSKLMAENPRILGFSAGS
tara:strand:- start:619 stop:747 length:129 start_codon:yes stop_codon:yes gene_type:complete